MRVVFMGAPAFAVSVLRRLVEDHWDVAAVYTQPDKPKNRGMKLTPTPVKEYAVTQGIPVYQPASCRDEAVLEELRAMEPDVIVVAAYGKLLPQALLDIPRTAIINVHSSLLPQYRGAAPINWAILNGDEETGVTIQYMAAELDAGDILLAKKTAIDPREDAGQLYTRLSELGAEALSEAVTALANGTASRTPQTGDPGPYAAMLTKEMSPVDWTRSAREINANIVGSRVGNRTDVMLGGQPCEDYDVDTLTREIKELEQTLTQTERQPDSPAKNGRIGKLRMQILVTKSKLDQSRKERDQIAQQAQEVPEGEEAPPPRRMRCTTVHPGVVLSIDGVTYHFRDQVSPCSATLSDGEIRLI